MINLNMLFVNMRSLRSFRFQVWCAFFIFYSCTKAIAQQETLSGLNFASHEVNKDKRTSLCLTPHERFTFVDGFSIKFDAKFRPKDGYYGYIFRIIGSNKVNIDLIANLGEATNNFSLIYGDNVLSTYTWEEIPNGALDVWTNFEVTLDSHESKISISINGNKKEKKVKNLADVIDFDVVFGACKIVSFLTTDVAPMTLKNVVILKSDQEKFREWKLSKHLITRVFDEIQKQEAIVQNPNWEIDKHLNWSHKNKYNPAELIGIALDEDHDKIYFICATKLFIYHTPTSNIDTIHYLSGKPYPCQGNQVLYNRLSNELWSYNFEFKDISIFDFSSRTWSLKNPVCEEPDLWLHNRMISEVDTTLFTFGGYGHYSYKNKVNQYDFHSNNWKSTNLNNQIYPRYQSALGKLTDQKLLIFGGYGSKTGRQELSPEFYYDLNVFDKKQQIVDKLWSIDTISNPFVPCEKLLVDSLSNHFFTLIYNPSNFETYLKLAHFSIESPTWQLYGDSIPYQFLDTKSWSSFYLNSTHKEIIAITLNESKINLYSLAFPFLLPQDVYQVAPKIFDFRQTWFKIVLGVLLVMILIFFKDQIHLRVKKSPSPMLKVQDDVSFPIEPIKRPTVSSICLLGGFTAFDKNGNDITIAFTPTIKQLFLLIFHTSMKEGKGVSSVKLGDTLWFDKTGTSARNNRNVNISKLRVLLESIGGIELESNKSYWKINVEKDFYCDYLEVLELIKKSRSKEKFQQAELFRLIQIVSYGELCPNIQTEWMDEFKVSFANEVIDALMYLSDHNSMILNNSNLQCNVAECILKFDTLNEEAIKIKCTALYRMGKKGISSHVFSLFCKEYKEVLGEEYHIPFNELILEPLNAV